MFHIRRSRTKQKRAVFLRHPARPALRALFQRSSRRGRRDYRDDLKRGFLRLGERRTVSQTGRRNLHEHEIRISAGPTERLLFRFEKAIDHQSVAFERGPAREPRRFSAAHGRAGVDRDQRAIRKRDLAPVRNAAWIDCAMAGAQTSAGRADVPACPRIRPSAAAGPVDRYSGEDRLFAGEPCGCQRQ
jgi:hypothetical protein